MEEIMLASTKHDEWSQKEPKDRDYANEVERRFFTAVEMPAAPSNELKELYRVFGKYIQNPR